ncbi:hypothetical protein WJX72_002417 [[Myrmecia] bisecta]|uniref:hydroxyethylthiazole kinase n=1 Tax=[Myrmecia] bisecta TaxID=41462 RepID=A0AAW1R4D9_9CHLO
MDLMANTLLAAGASPAMVHATEEAEQFIQLANALLINVGTLSPTWVESMKVAAHFAQKAGKPWILDPVGAGATAHRLEAIMQLMKLRPTLVRGNASEIMAVAGAAGATSKGVDSTAESTEALEYGMQLARTYGCIVAISGAEDLVTDGERLVRVANGVKMLQSITATGCAVTALAAAFVACAPEDPLLATAHAFAVFGLASEVAARSAKGPGSLRVGLLDQLYGLEEQQVLSGVRLRD